MKIRGCQLLLGVVLGFSAFAAAAGASSGTFTVEIKLINSGGADANGTCVSQSLSEQTNALVQVVCQTGQFVSIAPLPGKAFLGTHGGAFRYTLGAGRLSTTQLSGEASPYMGAGTVTALRIYNANGADGPLEMLVSF